MGAEGCVGRPVVGSTLVTINPPVKDPNSRWGAPSGPMITFGSMALYAVGGRHDGDGSMTPQDWITGPWSCHAYAGLLRSRVALVASPMAERLDPNVEMA